MLFLRLFLFLLLIFPLTGYTSGPAKVGLHLDVPQLHTPLDAAQQLPSSFLLWDGIPGSTQARELGELNKPLWVSSGLQFIRSYDVRQSADSLSTAITDPLVFYRRLGLPIHTYILAAHPQTSDVVTQFLTDVYSGMTFHNETRPALITTPKAAERFSDLNTELIFAIDEMRDLDIVPEGSTVYILPPTLDNQPAHNLRELLQTALHHNLILILPASYVLTLQDNDSRIIPLLNEFTTRSQPVFALAEPDSQRHYVQLTIIALVICWLIFGMFYFGNGHYHRGLKRYLFTHNFYVNDVMNRRLKIENDLIIALFVIGLFFGLFLMILAQAMDTALLSRVFSAYTPAIYPYITNEFIVFGAGFTLGIVWFLFGVIWLFAAGGGAVSPGQIMMLYVYPLHVTVPAATLIAVLQLNQIHGSIHLIITGLTVAIIIISMIIAATDIAPYLQRKRRKFMLLGPTLYALTLGGVLLYLIIRTPFIDTLHLIVQLLD